MSEKEFLDELRAGLRVGRIARRRILLEMADHLRSLEANCPGSAIINDRLGSPTDLAEDFNLTYTNHRQARLKTIARVAALGFGATLVACVALLTGDPDGDRNPANPDDPQARGQQSVALRRQSQCDRPRTDRDQKELRPARTQEPNHEENQARHARLTFDESEGPSQLARSLRQRIT